MKRKLLENPFVLTLVIWIAISFFAEIAIRWTNLDLNDFECLAEFWLTHLVVLVGAATIIWLAWLKEQAITR